ncbi:hypothetical protein ABH935_007067 [Catenulispora sp. GAS73]|uniref:hypothetical protein n=1 Tax=Catenulispora sp. GAS73 TaxID=3156269 RepID=UPI003511DB44
MAEISDADRERLQGVIPPANLERMGRMAGWAYRLVLAMVDDQPEVVAAVVDSISTFDDQPGRPPYPLPRWNFVAERVQEVAEGWLTVALDTGRFSGAVMARGAAAVLATSAPPRYRDGAIAMLDPSRQAVPSDGDERNIEAVLMAAALGAWAARNRKVFPIREAVRLKMIEGARDAEATALGVPYAERVSEVSDADALAFIEQMYGHCDIPDDSSQWGLAEIDIVSMVKLHLLETPADATSPEQTRDLDEQIKRRLLAALATGRSAATAAAPAPPRRPPTQRHQPKRKKPKGKR